MRITAEESSPAHPSCGGLEPHACTTGASHEMEEEALLARIRLHTAGSQASTAAPDAMPSIEGFRVVRLIAEGGMGRVYEAQQLNPMRRAAIKLLRSEGERAPHRRRLFQREADALARLRHPDIAVVYSAGETSGGEPFLAMELVQGETLDAYAAHHAMWESDILRLFVRICRAVQHAHERGVIHRDLKPSNIMVDPNGNPKVLDFGLARIAAPDAGAMTSVTLDGRIAGTLAYMSPEQVSGRAGAVDARADIYALGVILYQLLTGRLPIEVSDRAFAEIVDAIRTQSPTPPGRLRQNLDPGVEQIVLRALRKNPHERYQSARELADDIDRRLNGAPIAPAGRRRRARTARALAGVALTVASVALGLGFRQAGIAAPTGPDHAGVVQPCGECDEAESNASLPIHRLGPMITLFGDLGDLEAMLRTRLEHFQSLPSSASEARGTEIRLALVLEEQGRYAEAERFFRDSLDDNRSPPYRRLITMVRIARCVGAQGDHEQAGRMFAECTRAARRLGPQQASVRAEIQVAMARDLMSQGRRDDARLLLDQAYTALDDSALNAKWSRWSVASALADCAHLSKQPTIEESWRAKATETFNRRADVIVCQR